MTTVQTAFKIVATTTGTNNVRELRREIDNVSTSSDRMKKVVSSAAWQLRGALSGLAAGYGGLQILRRADEFNMLRGRIALSTESVREADQAWRGLSGIALQTGAQMSGMIDVFQRLSFVRKEIGATVDDMLVFTDTVSKLGAMSGAGPEALRAGLTQLGQGLSNSILRAEEFNSIMENIPAVGKAIADELGVTTGQLRNLVVDGVILSSDVFGAVLNSSVRVREEFERYPESIARASAQFSQAFGIVAQGIDQTTGATQTWIGIVNFGTNALLGMGKVIESVINTTQALFRTVFGGLYNMFNSFRVFVIETMYAATSAANKLPFINLDGAESALKGKYLSYAAHKENFQNSLVNNIKQDLADASAAGLAATQAFKGNRAGALGQTAAPEAARRPISQDYAALAAGLSSGDKKGAKDKSVAAAAREAAQEMRALEKAREKAFSESAAGQVAEYANSIGDVSKSIGGALVGAFRSAEDALVQFTTTGKLEWRSFALSIIEDLARIQIQQSITGPLSQMLGSFLGGAQGSYAMASARGALNPALYGPGFATGGSFKVGGSGGTDSQLVAFRASPDERVTISRGDQGGGLGNVLVTVNVGGQSDVAADSAQGRNLGLMIAQMIESKLISEKRPGGLLAGA